MTLPSPETLDTPSMTAQIAAFALDCARQDLALCDQAGRSYRNRNAARHAVVYTYKVNDPWVLLRGDGDHLAQDYAFLEANAPGRVRQDLERKIALLEAGDPTVVRILAQQWRDRDGFRREWKITT